MFYKCDDCGSVFDERDITIVEEKVAYYGDAPYIERWNACPFCESTDIYAYNDEEDDYVESETEEDE